MWKTNAQRAAAPPADGMEVFVLGRPTVYEEQGRVPVHRHRICSRPRRSARRSRRSSGSRRRSRRTGCSTPRGSGRCRAFPRASPSSRAPTAPRCATSSPSPGSAGRRARLVRRRRAGAGRRRRRRAGAGARGWSTGSPGVDLCIVGRGGGAREDLARLQRRGGVPRRRRGARPDDLRRGPRDRHLALRPRRRLRARHARPPPPSWPCPTGRACCASWTTSARAWPAGSRGRTRLRGRAAGAHRRPAARRARRPALERRRDRIDRARRAARRAEPAPRARARLRGARGRRRPRCSTPGGLPAGTRLPPARARRRGAGRAGGRRR